MSTVAHRRIPLSSLDNIDSPVVEKNPKVSPPAPKTAPVPVPPTAADEEAWINMLCALLSLRYGRKNAAALLEMCEKYPKEQQAIVKKAKPTVYTGADLAKFIQKKRKTKHGFVRLQGPIKETSPEDRCSCMKSQCKRKYCPCFQAKRRCGAFCQCSHCHNRQAVTLSRFPRSQGLAVKYPSTVQVDIISKPRKNNTSKSFRLTL